jgi:hypothetical protein
VADVTEFVDGRKVTLSASTNPNWKSWGESLRVEAMNDGVTTSVAVESWSTFTITAIDWGQNRRNVEFLRTRILILSTGC